MSDQSAINERIHALKCDLEKYLDKRDTARAAGDEDRARWLNQIVHDLRRDIAAQRELGREIGTEQSRARAAELEQEAQAIQKDIDWFEYVLTVLMNEAALVREAGLHEQAQGLTNAAWAVNDNCKAHLAYLHEQLAETRREQDRVRGINLDEPCI